MHTILIVDDEPNYQIVLAELLKDEGYEVFTANSGLAGLPIVYSTDLDLVLSDMAANTVGQADITAPRDAGEVEMHYTLASQKDYPARSVLFPGRLGNLELWILLLRFRDGRLYSAEVVPT